MTTTQDTNPATLQKIQGTVENTDLSTLGDILTNARRAQAEFAQLNFKARAAYVLKMRDYLKKHADKVSRVISQSNGKTLMDAITTEVLPCVAACHWYAKNSHKHLRPKNRALGSVLFFQKRNRMEYAPLGVVGIISPWNYPFSIPFGELIMALMAGNAVVMKVAEATSQVGVVIEEIVRAAGLPEGLFTMLYGRGSEISNAMLQNGIDKIFFTGSVAAGKTIMAAAAQTLTPVSLELGGNDAAIVLADADIERTSNGLLWAAFQNSGQSCGGAERLYVQAAIYEPLMQMMRRKVNDLRQGVPDDQHQVEIGAMTTAKQLELVKTHVADALAKGARISAQSQQVGDIGSGYFYPATLIEDCNHDMIAMREETFGPTLNVMRFDSIDEAVALANDSNLGLTGSIWSKDVKAARQLASRLEAGVITINDHLYTHGMAETPWGGWKQSGIGRTHGQEGLLEMVNPRMVNWDWLNAKNNLWWHPYNKKSYRAIKDALQFAYPDNLIKWAWHSSRLTVFMLRKMFSGWKRK